MRDLWKRAALCMLLAVAAVSASAQVAFPAKPLRFVVPYPPGGGTDVVARLVGGKLTEAWGQPVLIDFRPGASATLGPEIVAKSPADGYTFCLVTSTFSMTPALQKVPYDAARDFTPLMLIASVPNILMVHPSLPARTLNDLVQLARARPGELSYASSGVGSVPHLTTEMLRLAVAPFPAVHVPYRGNALAATALMSGEIAMAVLSLPSAVPLIANGRLRPIAVTSGRRSAAAPHVPTLAESGATGYDFASEWGLLLPARMQPEVLSKMHNELARIVRLPDVSERLAREGAEVAALGPEEYGAAIRASLAKWSNVVRAAKIRAE